MEEAGLSTRMCYSGLVSLHEPRRRKPLAWGAGLVASGEARWRRGMAGQRRCRQTVGAEDWRKMRPADKGRWPRVMSLGRAREITRRKMRKSEKKRGKRGTVDRERTASSLIHSFIRYWFSTKDWAYKLHNAHCPLGPTPYTLRDRKSVV